ncbi:MAG: Mrp/NBP35 family ATP-binding protein [Pseudomonadota bacterium]
MTGCGTNCECGGKEADAEIAPETALAVIPGVRDVVLIASGKGGVGKSTLTVNLAASLTARGLRTGVLDADLTGPSVARMLGSGEGLATDEQGRAVPAFAHGIWSVSMGNLVPPEATLAWKGPIITQATVQMFREVAWPDLDVLLVDLPPGTGDVQLTILEQIPVAGAVIVSTPQKLATIDAERGIAMFHELDIPVFGLVENMFTFICPCCGEEQPLFGAGQVEALAKRRHVPFLGRVPLDPAAQSAADDGSPLVTASPQSAAAKAFGDLAGKTLEALERDRKGRGKMDPAESDAFWRRLVDE